jgi:hypothetical protein
MSRRRDFPYGLFFLADCANTWNGHSKPGFRIIDHSSAVIIFDHNSCKPMTTLTLLIETSSSTEANVGRASLARHGIRPRSWKCPQELFHEQPQKCCRRCRHSGNLPANTHLSVRHGRASCCERVWSLGMGFCLYRSETSLACPCNDDWDPIIMAREMTKAFLATSQVTSQVESKGTGSCLHSCSENMDQVGPTHSKEESRRERRQETDDFARHITYLENWCSFGCHEGKRDIGLVVLPSQQRVEN